MRTDLVKAAGPEFGKRYKRIERLKHSTIEANGVIKTFSWVTSGDGIVSLNVKSEVVDEAKMKAAKPGKGPWIVMEPGFVGTLAPKKSFLKVLLASLVHKR